MKKTLLSAAVVFAAVVGAFCYSSESRNENEMSDLAKANVKALAIDENRTQMCFSTFVEAPHLDYPGMFVTRCSDCTMYWAIRASDPSKCGGEN